jgi:hypothetical protein
LNPIAKLKCRCSRINKTVLWIKISIREKLTKALVPILFIVVLSFSPIILWGIVNFAIAGFKNAINTVAVVWNPQLPLKISIRNPTKNA